MANLKVPSLQHLARIWRPDPHSIAKVLVRLTTNGPTFSYSALYKIVGEMLRFGTPYEDVLGAVRKIKRADVRENFLSLMPLIRDQFQYVKANYVAEIAPRYYSIDRDIRVPFAPPFAYGSKGVLHFPWLSFWKTNPLEGEALSLFVTVVEEVLLRDSDLDEAKFEIIDFSSPIPSGLRSVRVIDADSIERVSKERKIEMLSIFAEGFRIARVNLENKNEVRVAQEEGLAEDQFSLF